MPARSPEQICALFKQYMSEGDLDALLGLYDPEAAFLNPSGDVKKGYEGLKKELTLLAASKAIFDFQIKQIVEADGIALMHTDWQVSAPKPVTSHAIEVARRQADGTWRWLIGDPFTVDRRMAR